MDHNDIESGKKQSVNNSKKCQGTLLQWAGINPSKVSIKKGKGNVDSSTSEAITTDEIASLSLAERLELQRKTEARAAFQESWLERFKWLVYNKEEVKLYWVAPCVARHYLHGANLSLCVFSCSSSCSFLWAPRPLQAFPPGRGHRRFCEASNLHCVAATVPRNEQKDLLAGVHKDHVESIVHILEQETEKKEVDAQKQLFDDYCIEFSKQYSPREREVRFSYFVASCKEIAEINEQQGHPVAGLSVFSDKSESERDFMRGSDDLLPDEFYSAACANNTPSDLSVTTHEPESPTSSSSVDWVKAGVVSPQVRSQYQDQCWANASIECVESKVRLDSVCQIKERLSVQQVVDRLFDRPKTSLFDGGGLKTSTSVFSYGMEKGFLREEDYPTTGPPKTCESEGLRLLHKPRVFLTGLLPAEMRSNEVKLKECLKECPQYVTIGNDPGLAHYKGGIITSCKCKNDTKNHAVLLCGCGKQDGIKYWRFKNSWGEAWGERGFFRLVRNKGMCRIGQFFNRAGKTKVFDPSFMKEPKSREDVKEAEGGAGSCRVQSGCCSWCCWR